MLTPVQLLASHRLFEGVLLDEVTELAKRCRVRLYAPREVVFMKGDNGDGIFGILSGRIEISTSSRNGKEVVVASMMPGDIFGEIAVFDGAGRTATAFAIENSTLVFLQGKIFVNFAVNHPTILLHTIEVLCGRLRRTTSSLEDTVFLDVAGRVSKWLLANLPNGTHSGSATIRITQASLAREVGASREIVSRQLQIWKKSNLISVGRSEITINKIGSFRAFAEKTQAYG